MSLEETLSALGFEQDLVQKALAETGHKNVDAALDWIARHQSSTDDPESSSNLTQSDKQAELADSMAAKALKCNECTKEFTSVTLAQFHATKTGHQDFSESNEVRPELSAEEKTLKLEELRHILAEKKIKDKAAENARNLELEIQRRKSGVATQEARRELKEKEIAKAAEQLKREKMEDKLRLQRIRAEIEAERRERKNLADQKLSSESTVPESIESTTTQTLAARNGDIRIQIKYPGGTFKTVLKDEDNLSALVDKLATEACLTLDDASCLVVPFPRRVIKICDCLQSTLIHLGLSPSASLNLESL